MARNHISTWCDLHAAHNDMCPAARNKRKRHFVDAGPRLGSFRGRIHICVRARTRSDANHSPLSRALRTPVNHEGFHHLDSRNIIETNANKIWSQTLFTIEVHHVRTLILQQFPLSLTYCRIFESSQLR